MGTYLGGTGLLGGGGGGAFAREVEWVEEETGRLFEVFEAVVGDGSLLGATRAFSATKGSSSVDRFSEMEGFFLVS